VDFLRATGTHEEERRIVRTERVATGTLACPSCDAPIALTDGPVSPADSLTCPFCALSAPVRDFLSLAPPSRPTRVEVRIRRPARVR
jgi:hypothetical protein